MNFFTPEAQTQGEEIEISADEAVPFPGLTEPPRGPARTGAAKGMRADNEDWNRELRTDN